MGKEKPDTVLGTQFVSGSLLPASMTDHLSEKGMALAGCYETRLNAHCKMRAALTLTVLAS